MSSSRAETGAGRPADPTPDAAVAEVAELAQADVAGYCAARGLASPTARVHLLAGGVSARTYLVEDAAHRLVVKQALARLAVDEDWRARPDRVLVEAAALRLTRLITPEAVPEVLDVDAHRYALALAAAPGSWRPWKTLLLGGQVDRARGAWLGGVLARWHRATDLGGAGPDGAGPDGAGPDDAGPDDAGPESAGPESAGRDGAGRDGARRSAKILELLAAVEDLGGRGETFHQLRVDPFHRTVAARHPELAGQIEAHVAAMLAARRCLVHGDFSPKNVLVGSGGAWVIDFEVAHLGDPTFDVAFLVHHLLCKAVHLPEHAAALAGAASGFLDTYRASGLPLDERHLCVAVGCLALARVDGKSPAGYLTPADAAELRRRASRLIRRPPPDVLAGFTDGS